MVFASAWPGEVVLAEVFVMRGSLLALLGPQRSFAIARPPSPALRAGDKPPLVSWFGFTNRGRGSFSNASHKRPLKIRELERISDRRLAPYPSAASDGGQKMRRSRPKALPISNEIQCFTTADAFSGGRAHARMDARKTNAFAKATSRGASCTQNANHVARHKRSACCNARHQRTQPSTSSSWPV